MTTEVYESVWDALEDTPTEAENMKLRSSLTIAISEAVSACAFGNHIGRIAEGTGPRSSSRSNGLCGVSDGDIKTFTHSPERSIDLLELGRVTQIKEAIYLRAVPSQKTPYRGLCHTT